MGSTPNIVIERLKTAVPKFQKILNKAKEKDINESDTVTIITDMLEQVFGFDKYTEVTREYGIQGTYSDLAVKNNKKVQYLIEVKAIGLQLNDKHLRQVVNYASREGIKWVVLTNGIQWEIHRISLVDKVESEKLFAFDFLEVNIRKKDEQDLLFLLCRRAWKKDLIDDYYEYKKTINRYTIGALMLTEPVLKALCKELRKIKPGIKTNIQEIKDITENQVIKRDILKSETGIEINKQLTRSIKRIEKQKRKNEIKSAPQEIINKEG